jgi:hypothetical protein
MTAATVQRRHGSIHPTGKGVSINALHPAYRSGRTIFSSRVFDPDEVQRVLKDGAQSRKLGKIVEKGRLRGAPIFTLTLEERATCPRTCAAWGFCYGNGMQAAERIVAGPALEAALWTELAALQAAHPGGFLVRLHILGDFYSLGYVDLWREALATFPALHVFGFTARECEIGDAVRDLAENNWSRFAVRRSGGRGDVMAAQILPDADPMAITCPAQLGKTDCCATCALCWQSDRTIAFLRH